MLTISKLFIYPVKSLAGIELTTADVTDRGLQHDRRWMLVDDNNRFLSQRELARMALLKPTLVDDGVKISLADNLSSYIIPFQPKTNEFIRVTVWDDTCTAQLVSPEADAWFSKALNFNCRLVYMPEDSRRPVDPKYASPDKITSFSDAYPFLLVSEESLKDLSNRVGQQVEMERFRPNIVFTGGEAFAEDEVAHFTVGSVHFYGVKLCARCPVPNIDPATALSGKEPIKTLSKYRRLNNKVYLGQNLIHQGVGDIKVGDEMELLKVKAAPVFD